MPSIYKTRPQVSHIHIKTLIAVDQGQPSVFAVTMHPSVTVFMAQHLHYVALYRLHILKARSNAFAAAIVLTIYLIDTS